MKKILETERTILRELSYADYEDLAEILRCPRTMYAYEHGFSHAEVRAWLERQLERYAADGFGLWAVVDRLSGAFLGQCGLSIQEVDGVGELEVGYLFNRRFWHRGYATEAALACRDYAVRVLGRDRVVCTVRDTNLASAGWPNGSECGWRNGSSSTIITWICRICSTCGGGAAENCRRGNGGVPAGTLRACSGQGLFPARMRLRAAVCGAIL